MVVGGRNSLGVEHDYLTVAYQDVWGSLLGHGVLGEVPALDQYVACPKAENRLGEFYHVGLGVDVTNVHVAEYSCFAQVGCRDLGPRQQRITIGLDAAHLHQQVATGRDQDRIDHEVGESTFTGVVRHQCHRLGQGQHSGLRGEEIEILHHGVYLSPHDFGIDIGHPFNPEGVLRGDRSQGSRRVHTKGAEGPQVRLDPGPAARVRPGDAQCGDWLHSNNPSKYRRRVSTLVHVGELFQVGSLSSTSRLVVGTGGFRSMAILESSLKVSESTIATVALRRVDPSVQGSIYDLLGRLNFTLLPNTAGCYSADEAVKLAQLAREAFDTTAIKLEVIGDDLTLLPDTSQTLIAAEQLVREGFEVWAYTSDDLIVAQRLEQLGCVAVMPLGSPIGSGLGILNPHAIALIAERVSAAVLLDAGVGTASDGALAMELGCDGVLAASAINRALEPILMAEAMRDGVRAGYAARRAGRIPPRLHAEASSPALGRPELFVE